MLVKFVLELSMLFALLVLGLRCSLDVKIFYGKIVVSLQLCGTSSGLVHLLSHITVLCNI